LGVFARCCCEWCARSSDLDSATVGEDRIRSSNSLVLCREADRLVAQGLGDIAQHTNFELVRTYARTQCNAIERKCSQSGEESRALCRSQRKHHCSPLIAASMPDLVLVCADRVLCSSQAAFFRWLEHALPFQLLLLVVFLYLLAVTIAPLVSAVA
jgi:hypothetical protein